MSTFGNLVRSATLAAATVFTAACEHPGANAQAIIITPQSTESMASKVLRQDQAHAVRAALLAVARSLLRDTLNPGGNNGTAAHTATLQEALMAYRDTQDPVRLPAIQIDGKLGAKTAELIIHIAGRERMSSVFMLAPSDADPADAAALAVLRDTLAALQPVPYATAMRNIITTQTRQNRNLVELNTAALHRAFNECVYADDRSFSADIVAREISQISATPTYTSPYITRNCSDVLTYMLPAERERAQINFLNSRVMGPADTTRPDDWCAVKTQKSCLEYKV